VGPPAQPMMRRLRPWLPAIAWAILISWASTDTFSAGHTSILILPVLHWLFPHASAETIDRLHFLIRKSAHFTEYFVFSFLLLRGMRGEHRGWQLRWAIAALAIATGYSALDEFHQSFVPSRSGSPWDSLIDISGAATAQVFMWVWFWFHGQCSIDAHDSATPTAQG
jgi:VanZ family protein